MTSRTSGYEGKSLPMPFYGSEVGKFHEPEAAQWDEMRF